MLLLNVSLLSQIHRHYTGVRSGFRGLRVGRTGSVSPRVVSVCVVAVCWVGEVQRHSDSSRIHQPGQHLGSHTPVSVQMYLTQFSLRKTDAAQTKWHICLYSTNIH